MKIKPVFIAALLSSFAFGAAAQSGPRPAAGADASLPADGPVKVAVIAFEAVVSQTNEFQRNLADLQKKYEPKRQSLQTLGSQIETLQKQLQSQASTLGDAERERQARTVSEKQKQLQREQEDDQNDFQQEMQGTFSGVASKVGDVLVAYSQQHGYTLVLDGGNQQAQTVLYHTPATDISQAIVDAYNTKSGVPAPAHPQAAAPVAPRAPARTPGQHAPAQQPPH
ncbi:MAG TPA: OmpH family outer membrane protein [Terracidiphilus sp.]|jgi:outer membrane protein|nr:OmpH family outer membrane protein [Terracidiphilus sp.]